MRLLATLEKNFKLLFRNKESAYTIVFGPILIILLVSFAFVGSDDQYAIRIGTHIAESSGISERTIDTLSQKGYALSVYSSEEDCLTSVKTATSHACITFGAPKEENATVPVTFYLDPSRMNLVSRIAEDLGGEIEDQSRLLREQMASNTLLRMETAATLVEKNRISILETQKKIAQATQDLENAKSALASLPSPNVTQNSSDLKILKGTVNGLGQDVKIVSRTGIESMENADIVLRELVDSCAECSEALLTRVENVRDEIDEAKSKILQISEDATEDKVFEATLLIEYAIEDMDAVRSTLGNASNAGVIISETVLDSYGASDDAQKELSLTAGQMEYVRDFLRGERATVETLSSPISTSVVSVATTEDRLAFAYPYLLMLVIMFIGMLLSSMLIVMDKTSKAAFRNFTTPSSDRYHVGVAFLTAFIILFFELIVLLLVSSPFLAQPLLAHMFSTFVIAFVAIALFTFIGMLIGYLSNTQEAAMITSISIGSILLFISNLVVPIEGMASAAQYFSALNPYVALSELLKRSMLYGITFTQFFRDLWLPLLSLLILLVITLAVQRQTRKRYFRQEAGVILTSHTASPLSLGQHIIHNEVELLDALDRMTRSEFESVTQASNPISSWVEQELRDKRLAKQLRNQSKERMILRLDAHLKRHGKKIVR